MTDVTDVTRNLRTVLPRTAKPKEYGIVALSNGEALLENGTLTPETQIVADLPSMPTTVFASRNAGDFVSLCDEHWQSHPRWNWKATVSEREIIKPNGERLATRVTTVVSWFGFKGERRVHKPCYHLALDPITFYGKRLDDIWPGDEPPIVRLMAWATELRKWCADTGLDIRPTNGGMASQFLRDSRFYPVPRRKVPAAINARSREALPGNHYRLFTVGTSGAHDPQKEFQAIYLDQRRAHHYHARHTALPHADSLTARGRFITLDSDRCFGVDSNFTGLYYLRFGVPTPAPQWSPFPDAKAGTVQQGFVWSNEIPILTDLGYTIEGAIASWGSYKRDTGLRSYATWAEGQLDKHGDPKWLKPILLSTYGVLATRPKPMQSLYAKAKRGTPAFIHTGHRQLHGLLVEATNGRKIEPGFANVLHRGMIEAATRAESLGCAEYLHNQNFTVLSIYADAVLVEDDGGTKLPFLPDPWRVQQTLTHLQFINKQAFVSGEMTKLPGVINRDILKVSRGTMGKSPTKPHYEAISGRRLSNHEYRSLTRGTARDTAEHTG